jgi:hypothetical protein
MIRVRVSGDERGPCVYCKAPGRMRTVENRRRGRPDECSSRVMCLPCAIRIVNNERWAEQHGAFDKPERPDPNQPRGVEPPRLTTELGNDAAWNRGTPGRWRGDCCGQNRRR